MSEKSDLLENYRAAFDGRLGFGQRPALILIDFVRAYFDPDCELNANAGAALASALRVRDAARQSGVPVIYTNVVYHPDGQDGGLWFRKSPSLRNFTRGHPMGEWPDGLVPGEHELVLSKQYASAFFATPLASTLSARGIDSLILTGVSTSGCVRATCVDCVSHGFIPVVVKEAVGDRHPAPHEANLFDMNAKYGDVVSEADVLAHLVDLGATA